MTNSFKWVTPPAKLQQAIEEYGRNTKAAVLAVAERTAVEAQNEMRIGAPWTDRTGNARGGLFSTVEQESDTRIVIYFSHGHTIEYGVILELSNGGRYAIVVPTMQRVTPRLKSSLNALFG